MAEPDPTPTADPAYRRVVVIGGGIAGLAAAWQLAQRAPASEVVLLEGSDRVGGKLRLAEVGGVSVDVGAEALLARRPEGLGLARAVGLGDQLITPATLSAYVHAGGANHPLPPRTTFGIPGDVEAVRVSGVLTAAGLAELAGEPERVPMPPLTTDMSVGALVRDRLGEQVLTRLVEPLLGGVYAGRADELSLAATMPALAARLRSEGGSVVRAAGALGAGAPAVGPDNPVFVSLPGGLARLALELGRSEQFTVRTGVTVRAIRRTAAGFALDCGPVPDSTEVLADAVVVAVPAAKAAALLRDVVPGAAGELEGIETASMAIVTLALLPAQLPPGSGLLVGSGEGYAVKAVTLSSQKWPGTPADRVLLRASVGRAGQTRDLQREDGELVELVRRELADLVGVDAHPIDSLVTRWGGGLPQYGVGHVERVQRIRAAVATVPGLAVCGATYDGLGIPACIASANRAVDAVLGTVAGRG